MKEKQSLESKVISGLFWKFMERICAQAVTFIVSIILARMLAPSEYGTVTMVTIFITIANVFVVSGFGNALIQKKDADNIDFSTVFYFSIFFSVAIYLLMFILAPFVASFYDMPILTPVLRVLSIKIILAGINSVQQAYVSRHMMFFRFFWSTLIGTVTSAFVGITMAYLGFGVWALVAQYLVNSFIDTCVLWITVKWRPDRVFVFGRLKPLFNFGWKLLVDQLLSSIYNNLKSMVIGKTYTSTDLAFYSKGIQFPDLFVTNINSSISSVLFPALSTLQDNTVALKNGIRKSIRTSSFLLSPTLVGLFVVAPTLITLLLTDKWIECVPYLRIACVYYIFFPMTTANLEVLLAIGRSDISLYLTIVKRIVGVSLIFIAIKYGVWAVAMSDLFVVIVAIFLNAYYISKLLEYSVWQQLNDVLPSLLTSVAMGSAVYGISLITVQFHIVIGLIIQVVTGVIVYLVLAYIFNKNDMMYFIIKIRDYTHRR